MDSHVARLWASDLQALAKTSPAEIIILPPGESRKRLSTIQALCRKLASLGVERGDTLIACGGGVIGDIVGFTAACYLRGIAFVQIPTTLLAMVDASVGGKTGVDLPEGKNLVGAFHQPRLVLVDTDFLTTLPRREFRSGLAEVVKTALLSSGANFAHLRANIEHGFINKRKFEQSLHACITFKSDIVSKDEKEAGLRQILNFGHTIGHALEALGGYRRLKHGEAVFWGISAAVDLSCITNFLSPATAAEIEAFLQPFLKTIPVLDFHPEQILDFLSHDKKVQGGTWRFVLLKNIGEPIITKDVSRGHLLLALKQLRLRTRSSA